MTDISMCDMIFSSWKHMEVLKRTSEFGRIN